MHIGKRFPDRAFTVAGSLPASSSGKATFSATLMCGNSA